MKTYHCRDCGHEVLADRQPDPIHWTDGHVCHFKLVAMPCERCGTEVSLGHFTCTCSKCGADYNWAGQRLAPRSQWGEETGEHLADILRIK